MRVIRDNRALTFTDLPPEYGVEKLTVSLRYMEETGVKNAIVLDKVIIPALIAGMDKGWKVRVARNTTESMDLMVWAETKEEANELAILQAGRFGENIPDGWEEDDSNSEAVYLPDEDSTELLRDFNLS